MFLICFIMEGLLYTWWTSHCWRASGVKQENYCTVNSCTGMQGSFTFRMFRWAVSSSRVLSDAILYEIGFQDSLVETAKEEASSLSNIISQATKWEYPLFQLAFWGMVFRMIKEWTFPVNIYYDQAPFLFLLCWTFDFLSLIMFFLVQWTLSIRKTRSSLSEFH